MPVKRRALSVSRLAGSLFRQRHDDFPKGGGQRSYPGKQGQTVLPRECHSVITGFDDIFVVFAVSFPGGVFDKLDRF